MELCSGESWNPSRWRRGHKAWCSNLKTYIIIIISLITCPCYDNITSKRIFLRCTSLMEPWHKLVWLILLVFSFIRLYSVLSILYKFRRYLALLYLSFFLLPYRSCMLVLMTRFLMHALIWIYRYNVLISSCHLASHHHSLGSFDSLDPHV